MTQEQRINAVVNAMRLTGNFVSHYDVDLILSIGDLIKQLGENATIKDILSIRKAVDMRANERYITKPQSE